MKKILCVLILMVVSGCTSTLYDVDPDVSKSFNKHNGVVITRNQLKRLEEDRAYFQKEFERDMLVIGKNDFLQGSEDAERLKTAWEELLLIHDTELRTKVAYRIDDVRIKQYADRIEGLRREMNKRIRDK